MRVITAYPIIRNGKVIANKIAANTLNFSSAAGDVSKTSTGQAGKVQKARGAKAIDILSKAKEAGLGDAALKTISALRNKTEVPIKEEVAIVPVEKGMSTNTKIAIGVAVAAVLGVTIYAVAKK